MNQGRTLFSQLMDYFPERAFQDIVERYGGNKWVRSFPCRSHFNVMLFAQLTGRESLRDIEACLSGNARRLYHMGIRGGFSRNNLAHANEVRDWRIYRDAALLILGRAQELYAGDPIGVDIEGAVYAFDSSTIELCLTLFPWARFQPSKAGVKMHACVDVRGNIPAFLHVTQAASGDVKALDELSPEPGACYLVDRGYHDYGRLYAVAAAGAFFVTRARRNTKFGRGASRPVDKTTGLRSDQAGRLCGVGASGTYPAPIRRVTFRDPKTGRRLCFLTNLMDVPALDVCNLYRMRWQVELFFKWAKGNLRIRHFLGTSVNAVHIQLWTALAAYALVAITARERLVRPGMYEILQFLSVSIFEKTPINEIFNTFVPPASPETPLLQGFLF
ncbi:MAG: IS4 family transposase [Kiritimatiellaeota bacterium]|nr:IS4 family transposase [Kiritimatiellota bacterium]